MASCGRRALHRPAPHSLGSARWAGSPLETQASGRPLLPHAAAWEAQENRNPSWLLELLNPVQRQAAAPVPLAAPALRWHLDPLRLAEGLTTSADPAALPSAPESTPRLQRPRAPRGRGSHPETPAKGWQGSAPQLLTCPDGGVWGPGSRSCRPRPFIRVRANASSWKLSCPAAPAGAFRPPRRPREGHPPRTLQGADRRDRVRGTPTLPDPSPLNGASQAVYATHPEPATRAPTRSQRPTIPPPRSERLADRWVSRLRPRPRGAPPRPPRLALSRALSRALCLFRSLSRTNEQRGRDSLRSERRARGPEGGGQSVKPREPIDEDRGEVA